MNFDYTEKELQEWQKKRGREADEKEIRTKCQNRLNNAQGQHFEREILAGCGRYKDLGLAVIDKTPEPFRVMKKNPNGVFTGRFTALAQPDFQGTLKNGRSIVFEAKMTMKNRIQRNVLTDTQMNLLEAHRKLGAFAAVCVSIEYGFYFIPWKMWRDMKDIFGHQYVTSEQIAKYEVKFDGAVRFLEYKSNAVQETMAEIWGLDETVGLPF